MNVTARIAKRILATAALAGVGFLGGSVVRARWLDAPTAPAPAAALGIDHTADLTAGPATAPVTVRIFGDYACAACAQLEHALGDTLQALARNGTIRLVYLQRPLAGRQGAHAAAAVVACEPDPLRRWRLHRRLYEPVDGDESMHLPALAARAARLLPDDPGRASCVRSDSTVARAERAIAAARAAGFQEVPTVVVNDRHVRFRSHEALLRRIRRAVTEAAR